MNDVINERNRMNTAEKLHATREAAAQRFEAVAMFFVPTGWTVQYRKSLSGVCNHTRKVIAAPRPRTRKALYIFLHECAHAHLHGPKTRKPRHVKEWEAERWTQAKMCEHGIAVPRVMQRRAKTYVGYKIAQAMARGAKSIDPRAKMFAGSLRRKRRD